MSSTLNSLSTLRDVDGRFVSLIQKAEVFIRKHFKGIVVAHTEDTSKDTLSILKRIGCEMFVSGTFGDSRIEALQRSLGGGRDTFFVCDFDKILHWIRVEPGELAKILKKESMKDYVAYGRSEGTWKTYPTSWYYPETVINHLASKVVGFEVDALTSVAVFKREAAEVRL